MSCCFDFFTWRWLFIIQIHNSTHITNVFRNPSDIETDDDYTSTVQNYQNLYLQAFKDYDLEQEIVGFYKKTSDMNLFSKVDDLKDWETKPIYLVFLTVQSSHIFHSKARYGFHSILQSTGA